MIWFLLGLMVGGFLGMMLMAIFASRKMKIIDHVIDEEVSLQ